MAEIILGNSYEFTNSLGYFDICIVSETKFIVSWFVSDYIYIRVGNIINDNIQYGQIYSFYVSHNSSMDVNIEKLNDNKFILIYGGYNGSRYSSYGRIINLETDDSLIINNPVTIVSSAGSLDLCESVSLDENHVIICQRFSSDSSRASLLIVSGNSFIVKSSTSGRYYPRIVKINSTQAVFSYNYVSGHTLKLCNIINDDMTISSIDIGSGRFGSGANLARINDNKFIVYYPVNKSRICDISNNQIILGNVNTVNNFKDSKYKTSQIDENNFLTISNNKIYIGNINNEILSFINETEIDVDITNSLISYVLNNKFLVAYKKTIGNVKICNIISEEFNTSNFFLFFD